MGDFQLTYKKYGTSAVLIEWPEQINKRVLKDIQILFQKISLLEFEDIVDINFVYCSMLVIYNPTAITFSTLKARLKNVYNEEVQIQDNKRKRWRIPVCYEIEFATDLLAFAERKGISEVELIQLHTKPIYTIYGMGFLPGFTYLGGLPDKLFMPRKETPSLNITAGSVAIGGHQTGIYPQNSPGGWHVIGRTPILIFDSNRENSSLVSVGDEIAFYAVSKAKFELITLELESDVYKFEEI